MRWEVDEGLATLTFSNGFAGNDGTVTPVLNSVAVYRTGAATPEAVWLDSRPMRIEIRWEASDTALVSHWTAPAESGRTTYRILSTDALEVIDEVASGAALRVFGRAHYTRVR